MAKVQIIVLCRQCGNQSQITHHCNLLGRSVKVWELDQECPLPEAPANIQQQVQADQEQK